jgi:hypothetical protein
MKRLLTSTLVAVAAVGLAACGPEASTCTTEGAEVEIVDNHRTSGGDHQLEVSADDVNAGVEVTYDIRGDNTGHTHEVTVSADDFADLQEGTSVELTSTDTGAAGNDHTHTVRLSCPS